MKLQTEVIATFNTNEQDFFVMNFTEEDFLKRAESNILNEIIHSVEGDITELVKLSLCLKFKDEKHYQKMMKNSEAVRDIMSNNGKYHFNEWGDII